MKKLCKACEARIEKGKSDIVFNLFCPCEEVEQPLPEPQKTVETDNYVVNG
jgi:hypothetical protein